MSNAEETRDAQPPSLPQWVDEWCRAFLEAAPAEALFCVSHLSEVIGVRLADGREVVLKRRADPSQRTQHCVTAQKAIAQQGFPCPLPLTGVIHEGGIAVHAEQFVPDGERDEEDTPAAAQKSAMLLADLLRRLAALDVEPPLPNPEWVRWESPPERHGTQAVPAWLDDTSRIVQSKLGRCTLPRVLGHADWEAQNMCWKNGRPLAVHDWDSLAWLPEAAIVGTAAGVFASHGKPTLAPLASSAAFLDAYEQGRCTGFSSYAREIAWAASIWVALHNARDELIFDRPKLSYERLQEQRLERLARAGL